MMRDGRLLCEDTPARLLKRHGAESLEEVFLQLCRGRDGSVDRVNNDSYNPTVRMQVTNRVSMRRRIERNLIEKERQALGLISIHSLLSSWPLLFFLLSAWCHLAIAFRMYT